MPLTADGCLVDQTPMSTQSTDILSHAPPLYGEHVLDQLYADMDQPGFMTPAPQSGMNTPYNALSRAGSSENLASLGGTAAPPNGAVPPAALSSRLQNLNTGSHNNSFLRRQVGSGSGGNTPHSAPHNDEGSYFDNNHSSNHSNPLSRRTSEEEVHHASNLTSGQHTPEHVDHSDPGYTASLSKVPSYSTAVKAPVRGMSYTDAGALPNYETATSMPPSPERTFSSPAAPSENGYRRNPLSGLGFTHIGAPPPVHLGDGDERRRLHWLQSSRERAH